MFTKIECGECGGDYAPKWDDLFQRWPDMTHHCPSCGRANVSVGLNSVLIETAPVVRFHACGIGGPGSAPV